MSGPSEAEALGYPSYWDEHYAQSDGEQPTHEWYRSFDNLVPFFSRHLFEERPPSTDPHILHLGSGDSTVPQDLAAREYRRQLCVDFSPVLVEVMSKRHQQEEGIKWMRADVRSMTEIPDKSIDVAFDKATMDAMIHGSPWNPPESVLHDTAQYLKEVRRVLKDDGVFLCITFRQPHFIKPILNRDNDWNLDMEVQQGGESSFDYYGFTLKKPPEPFTPSI